MTFYQISQLNNYMDERNKLINHNTILSNEIKRI